MKDPIILLMSGAALGLSVQILINLVTSSKYVCSDNSNQLIVGLRAMEWIVVICSIGTGALAMMMDMKRYIPMVFYGSVVNGAITFLTFIAYMIVRFTSGCSECLTQDSVDKAMTNSEDSANFIVESAEMTGTVGTGSYIDNYLTPEWFQIPENYCRSTLQAIPGSTNDYLSSHAERCLVYNCTALVPGYGVYEGIFYACSTLQIIVAMLVLYSTQEAAAVAQSNTSATTGPPSKAPSSFLNKIPGMGMFSSNQKDQHLTF